MIKYSKRGLAENGKIPSLFNHLDRVIFSTFYLLIITLYLITYIIPRYSQFSEVLLQTFSLDGAQLMDYSFFKYQRIFIYFTSVFLLLILFMILAIIYSKIRSNQKQLRRYNVYTLSSTLFWGLLHFAIFLLFIAALIQKQYLALNVLRFVMILTSHFLKPFITLFDVRNNLPELFIDNLMTMNQQDFYVNHINFLPRREPLMPLVPFRPNAR